MIWDFLLIGGVNVIGYVIFFGGIILFMFDDDNQIQKGCQKCFIYRYKYVDGIGNIKMLVFVLFSKLGKNVVW